eukprot:9044744-Karenia_brevis.AAC.1
MWSQAAREQQGGQATTWPKSWRIGVVVPMWKRKGSKTDKNTWRGITLLSIGSKLLARVVAMRLSRWAEPWINEAQCGFRKGRGVDDVLQVSRRIAEEIARSTSNDWVLMSFFDIEKAYPRVCKDALWEVLKRRGCGSQMINILKALHEGTDYQVRILGGLSSTWSPDRGLREGCPSSPVLFNIYHDAVMQDFRARRAELAAANNEQPGIRWAYKVDGHFTRKLREGKHEAGDTGRSREIREVCIGDFGFADDTGIVGRMDEAMRAEKLFVQVLTDWEERVNTAKTERLRMSGQGRVETDVRNVGECQSVRQLGGWIDERGRHDKDTQVRAVKGYEAVSKVAKAWALGSKRGRGEGSGVAKAVRLQVMKAVVMP